ncbi:diguanylate phosphodiesterase [Nonomuraea aridisoli]|uniref:Diguanylate phosphodiesterase n=1 Tax=Nonomuraea aridisoli TaxID=2070368 RepID=A0A2W2F0S6_9ACTN|nr:diguanylate phosphodiesterase [Nonomuraea aridisoli]
MEKVLAAAGLGDAVDAGMDVFNVLAHLRRRQRELSGLYATARELTTVRAIDEVLQSIAERAQELVPSADASYIAVREDDGGFTVRASVGLTSPVFKQVHTRPGTGMAAKIAKTGSPLWIRCYAGSDTIVHDPRLDAALAEDQLVSVLGVPLKIRGEVVGILYAANRFERPPSAEESVLLGAFADHAAVALENARLFGELDAARRVAEEDAETIRRAAELHDRLTRLVLEGADVEEVTREISAVFEGGVRVLRPDARELREAVAESQRNGHAVATDGGYVTALGAGGARLGALVLETETPLSAPDLRNLESTAHILSLLVFRQRAIVEAEERVHGRLFSELATGGTLRDHQHLLAQARGFDLGGSFVAVFVRRESGRPADLAWAMSALARSRDGLGGEHGAGAGAFLPGTDAGELARFVHERLKRELGGELIVCAAEPRASVPPDAQLRLAERSAALLHSLGRADAAVSAHALGLYGIIVDPGRSDELATFLHATIGPLSEHDAAHGTALVDTVHTYFREGGNLAGTARALYVHPNTVVKRLARVAALLGDDWQSPDRALELHLALQLRWLADRI